LKYANDVTSTSIAASFIKFHPIMRLPEFLIGVILGRLYLIRSNTVAKIQLQEKGALYTVTGFTITIICCSFFANHIYQPFIYCGGLLTIFICMYLYGLACCNGFIVSFMSRKLFVRLG
jgi:peptidoglycan/LPS O-acetylase OafA/YrhL